MRKMADNLHTGNIINPWHVFNSACGELQGVEKRWVMDVDSKDAKFIASVKEEINRLYVEAWCRKHDGYWTNGYSIAEIPALNGVHCIVRPFNLQEFKKKFPDVEAKKNGLTALYVPECIANQKSEL